MLHRALSPLVVSVAIASCASGALTSSFPTAAYAQAHRAAPEIQVTGQGRSQRDCIRDAERRALDPALISIIEQETTLSGASLKCMATATQGRVAIKARGARMAGADRCEVPFTVTYDRAGVLSAGRKCMRSDVSAPVGIVLRGEITGAGDSQPKPDAKLTQQAIGQIADALGRANFEIVNLPQFQKDFLDMRLIVGQCAFTGDVKAPDWSDDCKRRFDDYMGVRDALTNKLSDALEATSSLRRWRECGGLFISGEVRFSLGARDVQGSIDVDYYALSGSVTLIAPFSDSRSVGIDLGGEQGAIDRGLTELTAAVVRDATQKLSKFAHSIGCGAAGQ
jgi:hypothetical protein